MHSKDLLVDNRRNREAIETVGKCLPQLDVISSFAFVIKPVDAVDRRAFMVPAKDKEIFRVFDLVCQKETNGFQRLLPTIDVITQE